jgi:fucose permease
MKRTYKGTVVACCTGYIVQAVVNNLAPLLFIVFQDFYGLSYSRLSALVSVNFVTQLIVDLLAAKYADKIGRRRMVIFSQTACAFGLLLLGLTPFILEGYEFYVLAVGAMLYAIGGGIIEVMVTPIAADCPVDNKAGLITILHSFYCWGQMGVILISTLLLLVIGRENWFVLPMLWSLIPLFNIFNFATVPIVESTSEQRKTSFKKLLTSKLFIVIIVLIFASGASELAMSQWASMFAEKGLSVSKTVGDIAGPCLFAFFMGVGRLIYARYSAKIPLKPTVFTTAVLCLVCYIVAAISHNGVLALIACAVTGFSITIMWPSAIIFAEMSYPDSGTGMYGLLAVSGDIGCIVGPWLIGLISDGITAGQLKPLISADTLDSSGLKTGILLSAIFPIIVMIAIKFIPDKRRK